MNSFQGWKLRATVLHNTYVWRLRTEPPFGRRRTLARRFSARPARGYPP